MSWQDAVMLAGAGLVPIIGLVVGALGRRLAALEARIADNDRRLDEHGERIASAETAVSTLGEIRPEIAEVHRRVDALPAQIGRVEGELAGIGRTNSMILEALVKQGAPS